MEGKARAEAESRLGAILHSIEAREGKMKAGGRELLRECFDHARVIGAGHGDEIGEILHGGAR